MNLIASVGHRPKAIAGANYALPSFSNHSKVIATDVISIAPNVNGRGTLAKRSQKVTTPVG